MYRRRLTNRIHVAGGSRERAVPRLTLSLLRAKYFVFIINLFSINTVKTTIFLEHIFDPRRLVERKVTKELRSEEEGGWKREGEGDENVLIVESPSPPPSRSPVVIPRGDKKWKESTGRAGII